MQLVNRSFSSCRASFSLDERVVDLLRRRSFFLLASDEEDDNEDKTERFDLVEPSLLLEFVRLGGFRSSRR